MKYYSREWNITRGNEYYSREPNITRGDQILLAGTIYYSRKWNITRGNEILLAEMYLLLAGQKNYLRERNITRGNTILLAEMNYYSREKILLAGKNYYSRESIYYSRERYITRGREILKYPYLSVPIISFDHVEINISPSSEKELSCPSWFEIERMAVYYYRQTSNIRRTLVGNTIDGHSDVVGAAPVGAAPTISSFWLY